ncbi:hypothetical protein DEU56DRAFT_761493 [Suillus clintonianus]|uniref:uncharacterized protein n=1 Tax=Suillus clintonianus TaxID=1904413 RepID=UPI001B87B283|nr:uncharacterized protein DEU56DRAFT_761493 [Suillus clintonianus]KAG2116816.1 hypothetical protein DEU56DRAFT_761493 [Suillus clintonianus]
MVLHAIEASWPVVCNSDTNDRPALILHAIEASWPVYNSDTNDRPALILHAIEASWPVCNSDINDWPALILHALEASQLICNSDTNDRPALILHLVDGEPPHRTDTCNVVIFGEVGAGKSSLVNLIAGTNMAVVSPDAGGCTTETNEHEILIQNETLKMVGFDEGPRGTVPDKEARRILKNLIGTLMKQGNIHLIMYCVRGERVIQTLRRNYEFIRSQIQRKVPIAPVGGRVMHNLG